MLRHNRTNLFFIAIALVSIISPLHCMDKMLLYIMHPSKQPKDYSALEGQWEWPINWQYEPLKQPNDAILDQKRKNFSGCSIEFCKPSNILALFPSSALIHTAKAGERPGVCYNDAMRRTLGLSNEQFEQIEKHIIGCQDWITILGMPYKFFNQKNKQKPGYLITYTSKGHNFKIHHCGVVIEENKIRSKLASSDYTYDHSLWDLPEEWGNRARLWKLQKKYGDDKNLLFETLLDIIILKENSTLAQLRMAYEKKLFKSDSYAKSYNLLKMAMSLNVNIRNEDKQTPLMIAAKNNNLALVTLYIEHHADLNLQDNTGNTALKVAADNKHLDVVQLLLDCGADHTIQDNNGNTAEIPFMMIYGKPIHYGTIIALGVTTLYCLYKYVTSK